MNELRKKFEGVAEIKIHLEHGNVFFDENKNTYASEFQALHFVSCYVNGAWMAFQEQQKKIDDLKSGIQQIWTELDDRQSKEYIIDQCKLIIKELLK